VSATNAINSAARRRNVFEDFIEIKGVRIR